MTRLVYLASPVSDGVMHKLASGKVECWSWLGDGEDVKNKIVFRGAIHSDFFLRPIGASKCSAANPGRPADVVVNVKGSCCQLCHG
ncbi:hypothetical protein CHARACLAT_009367 [Characodon lateralis]|uniref:Uncharacterized protein n=1 Tax=Characodon lateralis TaxID=208331 RepID=A0ABU7CMI8_9TELE|nr:hypothetical protein [Characodon lateralis]